MGRAGDRREGRTDRGRLSVGGKGREPGHAASEQIAGQARAMAERHVRGEVAAHYSEEGAESGVEWIVEGLEHLVDCEAGRILRGIAAEFDGLDP